MRSFARPLTLHPPHTPHLIRRRAVPPHVPVSPLLVLYCRNSYHRPSSEQQPWYQAALPALLISLTGAAPPPLHAFPPQATSLTNQGPA